LAVGSVVDLEAASEAATVDSEEVAEEALATADSVLAATEVAAMAAGEVTAALVVLTVVILLVPPMRLVDPAEASVEASAVATADGTAPEVPEAVGMAARAAAHAHMMTDLAEATVTATPDRPAATWSPSDRAARMVGMPRAATACKAAETTTGPETTITTIPASAVTREATKIPESCDATNKTTQRRLVVGNQFPHCSFLTVIFLVFPDHLDNEGKPISRRQKANHQPGHNILAQQPTSSPMEYSARIHPLGSR
jgi:hypothetical protein